MFLPITLALYALLPWRNLVLLVVSLIFYTWGDPAALPVLLAYIVLNYGVGLALPIVPRPGLMLAFGVAANLAILMVFKYLGFLASQIDAVFPALAVPVPSIALPLGISFIAFQGMSYLIDIHRGDVRPQRSLLTFAMYKSMFPQLIAGPIVRYRSVAARVDHRHASALRLRFGIQVFILGLAQKVLIANVVALPADQIYGLPPGEVTMATAWLGAICYALQIYFDFAGYSNMAIGMAHLFAFSFPPNFNRPYIAQSMTEFWRRWHISLSSWFRDYLYIPLGGSRGGAVATYRNLLIVFALCGFWHGATWNFLIWGLYNGALLMLERAFLGAWLARLWRPLRHLYLVLAMVLGWVVFRADTLPAAGAIYAAMFGLAPGSDLIAPPDRFLNGPVIVALLAGIALSATTLPKGRTWVPRPGAPAWFVLRDAVVQVGFLALFVISALAVASSAYNPFIYYRF
ncbi:MBOAT family O-acyltransferase [Humitalea sp. 24SJ18S-53]|uniref:MBOAT family O-acyltransferase n=1 Tax=Humitalea sp. 24SJ18S-53 TaxID=3422307 RepID=UPI003D6678B8